MKLKDALKAIDDAELRQLAKQRATKFSSNDREQASFALGFAAGFKHLFKVVSKVK